MPDAPNPYAPPNDAGPPPDVERDAIWALMLGLVSVFFCAPVTAPLAVWKAVRVLRSETSVRAIAGIVFAAFGVLTSLFFWFLAIWQFLSPDAPHPPPP